MLLRQPLGSSPCLKAFCLIKPSHFKSFKVSAQDATRIRPMSCQSRSNPQLKADFKCMDRVLRQNGPEPVNNLLSLPGISTSQASLPGLPATCACGSSHQPQQRLRRLPSASHPPQLDCCLCFGPLSRMPALFGYVQDSDSSRLFP